MNERTLKLTLELAGGKCDVFVHYTVEQGGDFTICRMTSMRDDDGEKVNLYPLLNINSIQASVVTKIMESIND